MIEGDSIFSKIIKKWRKNNIATCFTISLDSDQARSGGLARRESGDALSGNTTLGGEKYNIFPKLTKSDLKGPPPSPGGRSPYLKGSLLRTNKARTGQQNKVNCFGFKPPGFFLFEIKTHTLFGEGKCVFYTVVVTKHAHSLTKEPNSCVPRLCNAQRGEIGPMGREPRVCESLGGYGTASLPIWGEKEDDPCEDSIGEDEEHGRVA